MSTLERDFLRCYLFQVTGAAIAWCAAVLPLWRMDSLTDNQLGVVAVIASASGLAAGGGLYLWLQSRKP